MTPIHQGRSKLEVSIAPTAPETASIDPTERSIPAEQMTNVMPIAKTPKTEVESRIFRVLETDRKAFDSIAIATRRTASTMSDSSRTAPPPAKRARQEADAVGVDAEVTTTVLESSGDAHSSSERAAPLLVYLTYCSTGSLFASMISLVRTRVGTLIVS